MTHSKITNYIFYILILGAFFQLFYSHFYLKNPNYSGFYALILGAFYFYFSFKKTNLSSIWNVILFSFSVLMYLFYFLNLYLELRIGTGLLLISFLYFLLFLIAKEKNDTKS
ncbi:hypothetical protein MsAc7_14670 [Methanolapillus millepedarum]|uniref:Uncharacterized protein n=1 Tax=Methanolapillus millepedarum TaxID=3028296 RepID=A0AA96V3J7_9EURY|nr:hypothetical protein MsAc7_14670 [Methanosarcinaceae archaeon Ac7]